LSNFLFECFDFGVFYLINSGIKPFDGILELGKFKLEFLVDFLEIVFLKLSVKEKIILLGQGL
jgi:hypothetical protein